MLLLVLTQALLLQAETMELERCLAREEAVEANKEAETPSEPAVRPSGPPLSGRPETGDLEKTQKQNQPFAASKRPVGNKFLLLRKQTKSLRPSTKLLLDAVGCGLTVGAPQSRRANKISLF